MRRFLLPLALFALALPAVAPAGTARARVWLAGESPLTVRGSGFQAHERVTVTVSATRRFTRTVTATGAGAIVARWVPTTASSGGCVVVFVRAVGDQGSRAVWKSAPPECANGPTP